MKKVLKGLVKNQVKEQVSRILPRIKEFLNATLEAEVLTRSSHSSRTSYAIAADLSEMELKKILIEKMEGNNVLTRATNSKSTVLCCYGGGGSKRLVVVVLVVAAMNGSKSGKATGFGGERSMMGVDRGGIDNLSPNVYILSRIFIDESVLDELSRSSKMTCSSAKNIKLSCTLGISVSPSLITLSVSTPVLASVGEGVLRTIANSDCVACSFIAIAFPLPSTTKSGRVASTTGFGLGSLAVAGLACLAGAGFIGVVVRCIPDIVCDQLLRNLHSKDFIKFAFRNELEISKTEIIFSKFKRRPRPLVNIVMPIKPKIHACETLVDHRQYCSASLIQNIHRDLKYWVLLLPLKIQDKVALSNSHRSSKWKYMIIRSCGSKSVDTDKVISEGDTEILNIDHGKNLESRPPPDDDKMDEYQARSDPGKSHVALAGSNPEPMYDDFMATIYPKVHESLIFLADEQVILDDLLSSSRTLSSMKILDNIYTFGDKFFNDKSTKDEPRK
nr:hypothetical protein [Tanacetum cinerariifolium]